MTTAPLRVLFTGRFDAAEREAWWQALTAAAPDCAWVRDDAPLDPGPIEAAVVANPEPGLLATLPRLRLIQSLWAGVDRLLADPTLPPGVPIARMVDPAMNAAMAETALWAVLGLHRRSFDYAAQQARAEWRQHAQRRADEVRVLVLGAGQMGGAVAGRLAAQGYRVATWRARDGAPPPLADAEIVVNLLPLTPATRGLLDARFFAALPRGASIVNLARGAHVVDTDLLAALDAGHLQRAVLDVFTTEPLPSGHPFWRHPQVTVLPHVAALTDPRSASAVVAANLRALAAGAPLAHLVDAARGY
ncbi:MAG TPA: glyoxylate/hydroxypyruvate reductase A [Burkholderiaceae bacterium]|nr:glyoxylate/hydroxypyruvate reductase A [Burkholderiaceae bacterium]